MSTSNNDTRSRLGRGKIMVAALGGAAIVLAVALGSYALIHYTESTEFCTSCHVMNPEETAHQTSPHANVDCGTCHIGPGVTHLVESKVSSLRYLWLFPTGQYEKPIPSPAKSLRPAKDICEQCHWPEKFYADRLVEIKHYADDETNTPTTIAFAMRTGGGTAREGLGRGIHWHIENPVWYIATDTHRQDIPWVRVDWADGTATEYQSVTDPLSAGEIAAATQRRMDCLDCHNRTTHIFRQPEEALDEAIAQGRISTDLPYIKQAGVVALEQGYQETDKAAGRQVVADSLNRFYQENVPDADADLLTQAVGTVQQLYDITHFPALGVTWETHPDNIGHKEAPGCFRCHDGQHFSSDGEAIRLECNICHTLPQVAVGEQQVINVAVKPALPEPDSHRSTTWLAEHRFNFGQQCAACHTITNPGGSDNSSFCANSACHATEWPYANLNAPAIMEQIRGRLPSETGEPAPSGAPEIPHDLAGREDCQLCHATDSTVRPAPADHAGRTNDTCTGCHLPPAAAETPTPAPATETPAATAVTPATTAVTTPAATETPAATATGAAVSAFPPIPHPLEGREDCLACHATDSAVRPAPADHAGRTNDVCQACHQPQAAGETPTAAATETPALATATPPAATRTPTSQATAVTPAATATPVAATATTAPAATATSAAASAFPPIPHPLDGREDCLSCHAVDSTVRPMPTNHAGRTNVMCQACHQPEP